MRYAASLVLSLLFVLAPASLASEVGRNDFRISNTDGDGSGEVSHTGVAWNGTDEFFVVWGGFDGEWEVWGRRINATTGEPIGSDIRISDMGGYPAATPFSVNNPDVVYNATSDEYLVVWRGDDDVAPLVDGDVEIFGQRINASTGAQVGTNDFRISFMGNTGDTASFADDPAVAWDSVNNRYLVVWAADDSSIVDDEQEIFGRVLSSTGTSVSADDVRITHIGTDGDTMRTAREPDVVFDSITGRYLVVCHADPGTDNAFDIYGQFVTTGGVTTGSLIRISDLGTSDSDTTYNALSPRIVFNPTGSGEYLVVWNGDDNSLGDEDTEVWGQRLDTTGIEIGTNDFRITNSGTPGDFNFGSYSPDAVWNPASKEYFVVWNGTNPAANGTEVWGQRVSATGVNVGPASRLSDAGPESDPSYVALRPQVASSGRIALTAWRGDDDYGAVIREMETQGQFFQTGPGTFVIDGFTVAQGPVTLASPPPYTIDNYGANGLQIGFGGERNMRVSGTSTAGGNITAQVSGGALTFSRPAGSTGRVAWFWDGDNDTATFDPNNSTPIDITVGGTLDALRVDVNSSTSNSLQLLVRIWTTGADFATANFTLPLAGGNVDIPLATLTPSGTGADFTAVRAIYFETVLDSGAWSASIDSISVRSSTPPSAANTTISANPTSIAATGSSTSTITVQAKDAGGVNLPGGGSTVVLNTTAGSLGTVTDHDDGTYTATLTSSAVPDTAIVTGTIDGTTIGDEAVVTFALAAPVLTATATSTSTVNVAWTAVGGATIYQISRSSLGAPYIFVANVAAGGSNSHTDGGLTAGRTYLYRVRASNGSSFSPPSNIDPATTIVFTDASLAGVPVRAVHVTQLRTAVNAMRASAGLGAFSFTGALTAGVTTIGAVHVTELRTALQEARDNIGMPPIAFTDPTIVADSTRVKAVHVTQLRQGVQ